MIAVVNYDAGNLYSVSRALRFLDIPHAVTDDKRKVAQADGVILPGVGSASRAMKSLRREGLASLLASCEKPFLGICLGLQLLFQESEEHSTQCLGMIPGEVRKFDSTLLKVPHMGWNQLSIDASQGDPLLAGVPDGSFCYFIHSYFAPVAGEWTCASTDYDGTRFSSLIRRNNFWGAQFHPELSGEAGLRILRNFAEQCV